MRGKPIVIDQFTGLVDQIAYGEADANVPQAAALDCCDVIGRFGGIKSRSGLQANALGCPVQGTGIYRSRSAADYIVTSTDANVYNGAGVLIFAAAGSGAWKWAEGRSAAGVNYAYGVSAGNTPLKFTSALVGTNWIATTGTVQPGIDIAYTQARFFIGGGANPADVNKLAWCASGDSQNWPAANSVTFDSGDGDVITGVCALGPYVVVFKGRKTYLVYDLATGANRLVSSTVGCDSAGSYVVKDDTVYFYCRAIGMCSMGTDGVVKVLSRNVDSLARAMSPIVSAIIYQFGPSVAMMGDSIYVCGSLNWASPIGGNTRRTLEYHIPTGTWWTHSFTGLLCTRVDYPMTMAVLGPNSAGVNASIALYGEGVDSTGTNDLALGTYPQPWWASGALAYGAPGFKKRLKVVDIEGNCPIGTVSFAARTDGNPATLASGKQLAFVGSGLIQSARLGAGFATSPTGARTVDRYLSMSAYSTARAQWWIRAITANFTQRKN